MSCGESRGGMLLAHTCRSVSWGASNTVLFGSEGSLCACPPWSHSKGLRLLFAVNGCEEGSASLLQLWILSLRPWWECFPNGALSHLPPFESLGILWGCGGWDTGCGGCDSLGLHQCEYFSTNPVILNWNDAYFMNLGCSFFLIGGNNKRGY